VLVVTGMRCARALASAMAPAVLQRAGAGDLPLMVCVRPYRWRA
jgi:hypothetical protein